MLQTYLNRALWWMALVLLQVFFFNHIHLLGYATPFVYLYIVVKQISDISRHALMLWAFLLGLLIDIFGNTPGLNASAATFLALVRNPLLRSQTMRDVADDFTPSVRTMGFSPFARYVVAGVFLHILFLQLLDAFSFARWMPLLWKVLTDTAATLVCVAGVEMMRRKR